jgi:hypothetical protein
MLARLYPAAWRARYGAEYEALIDDAELKLSDGLDVLWGAIKMRVTSRSFVRVVLPCALAGTMVALGISLFRPAMYHSRTLITADTEGRAPVDDQLRELANGAFPASFLEQLIQKENLYPRERQRLSMGEVVDLMRRDIWLRRLQKTDGRPAAAFVLEFYYPEPHVAQRVDAALVSEMVALNLRMRINAASATTEFLEEQLALAANPASKAQIQSKLAQSQEAASHVPEVFRVDSLRPRF